MIFINKPGLEHVGKVIGVLQVLYYVAVLTTLVIVTISYFHNQDLVTRAVNDIKEGQANQTKEFTLQNEKLADIGKQAVLNGQATNCVLAAIVGTDKVPEADPVKCSQVLLDLQSLSALVSLQQSPIDSQPAVGPPRANPIQPAVNGRDNQLQGPLGQLIRDLVRPARCIAGAQNCGSNK